MRKRTRARKSTTYDIVRRNWEQKYQLPSRHQLWSGRPFAVHLAEFLDDKQVEREQLQRRLRDHTVSPESRTALLDSIAALDQLLGYRKAQIGDLVLTGDPVLDAFELADHLGEDVDLDLNTEEAERYLRAKGY